MLLIRFWDYSIWVGFKIMFAAVSDTAFAGAVALGMAGLAVDTAYSLFPEPNTSSAFQVHSVTATRRGNTAVLDVDRSINYPIVMGFSVRVFEAVDDGLREFCRMEAAPIEYQPDAVLPDVIDLSWWTHGKCPELPDGRAVVVTTWTPRKDGYDAVPYTFEVD